MRFNNEWSDYKIIATGSGKKLEQLENIFLLRPDPQIIWDSQFNLSEYKDITAVFENASSGEQGTWKKIVSVPESFTISWRNLKFSLKLMKFKHIGIFPEQAYNWAKMIDLIKLSGRPISVLNLFAYTGGASIACASQGASVCHVDASKAMTERAGINARLSGLSNAHIRYIIDDCVSFVEREIRRKHKYDAIIMDPPAYGRGPKGELWKIHEQVYSLVELTRQVLSDNPLFHLINSYASGLQPTAMENVQRLVFKNFNCNIESYEIGIPTLEKNIVLPCGASSMVVF
ncbi:MAG: class I SAM-dependent methyltransferase [Christensenellaceae bacterium]|nr:class I SAM-dependent methyltransferase [Christensenellaceae bacterium]